MKIRKSKIKIGMSLIVLVITIIVIIILATAIILTLNKNNPIEEANRARYESDVANIQGIFTNTVAKVMVQNQSTIEIEEGKLNEIKSGESSTQGNVKYTVNNPKKSENKEGIIVFDLGENSDKKFYTGRKLPLYSADITTWYVNKEGIISLQVGKKKYGNIVQVSVGEENITTPEYENAIVGEKVQENAKQYIDINNRKAIIPIGFAIVPSKNDISHGLVISDVENDVEDIGNQFVWIPVDNIETFVREEGYNINPNTGELVLQDSLTKGYYTEPLNYNGVVASDSEKKEYEKMISSISEYKGFYIGRYETSNNGENKVQTKKGILPWTDIKFANSMTDLRGGMVEKTREMYPEISAKKGNAVSTVVYGICWDEIVRFIRKNYIDVEINNMNYGNVLGTNENTVIPTGSKEEYAQNNIYDLTGNVFEKTMEVYNITDPVSRGGFYGQDYWTLSTRVQRRDKY